MNKMEMNYNKDTEKYIKENVAKKAYRIIFDSLEDIPQSLEFDLESLDETMGEILNSIVRSIESYSGRYETIPTIALASGLLRDIGSLRAEGRNEIASQLEGISIQLEVISGNKCGLDKESRARIW
jgi:hypothetical protein